MTFQICYWRSVLYCDESRWENHWSTGEIRSCRNSAKRSKNRPRTKGRDKRAFSCIPIKYCYRPSIFIQVSRDSWIKKQELIGWFCSLMSHSLKVEVASCTARFKTVPQMHRCWASTDESIFNCLFCREYLDNVALFQGCGEKLLDAISVLLIEVQVCYVMFVLWVRIQN